MVLSPKWAHLFNLLSFLTWYIPLCPFPPLTMYLLKGLGCFTCKVSSSLDFFPLHFGLWWLCSIVRSAGSSLSSACPANRLPNLEDGWDSDSVPLTRRNGGVFLHQGIHNVCFFTFFYVASYLCSMPRFPDSFEIVRMLIFYHIIFIYWLE